MGGLSRMISKNSKMQTSTNNENHWIGFGLTAFGKEHSVQYFSDQFLNVRVQWEKNEWEKPKRMRKTHNSLCVSDTHTNN